MPRVHLCSILRKLESMRIVRFRVHVGVESKEPDLNLIASVLFRLDTQESATDRFDGFPAVRSHRSCIDLCELDICPVDRINGNVLIEMVVTVIREQSSRMHTSNAFMVH